MGFTGERKLRRRPTREVAFFVSLMAALLLAITLTVIVIWFAPARLVSYDLTAVADAAPAPTAPQLLEAINNRRTALLQGLGGIVLFVGLGATFWQSRVTREGHIATTMSKAIENLARSEPTVGAGAAYTLQNVGKLSSANRWSIVQTLSTHIRTHSPRSDHRATNGRRWMRERAPAVQAAVDAVARMPRPEGTKRRLNLNNSDLSKTYFEDANLRYASMRNSDFSGSFFHGADMRWATCEGADFSDADLRGADVRGMRAVERATWDRAWISSTTKGAAMRERLVELGASPVEDWASREE